jgi:hypothetical protein
MAEQEPAVISVWRVRVGIIFFIIFWIPIWLIVPLLGKFVFGSDGAIVNNHVTIIIGTIQGIFGLLGLWLAGKQALTIVRKTSYRKMPKIFWHILWSGQINI